MSPGVDPIADALAGAVSGLRFADMPEDVGLRARYLMLDAVGCALAARTHGFVPRFVAATRFLSAGERGRAGVIGHAARFPLRDATVLNGVLMHGLDYDDTHTAGVVHLTVGVLPALLSLAASRDVGGADLLVAHVAGVEAGARLAMAARGGFHAQGFHPTGLIGAFASAWAVGRLLGFDAPRLVQAQGAALSMASGSLQFIEDGAWSKRWHAGWAALAGLTAAALAAEGVVTPAAPFAGRHGLYASHLDDAGRGRADLSLATGGLSAAGGFERWETMRIAVKPYALCHFVHAAADAAIELRRQGVDPAAIERVDVGVPEAAIALVCEPVERKRRPATDYDAKFSLHYAVASGLLRGRLGLRELEPDAFTADDARALMDRIHHHADPEADFPRAYGADVRITLNDGRRFRRTEAINRGHDERPLSNAQIHDKFMENACLRFSTGFAERVAEQLLNLDRLASVRTLMDLLARDPA